MDIVKELNQYNVSRETYNKIQKFVLLLQEWNTKMNLVSQKSIPDVWTRHVLDSVQLIKYIPENTKCMVDIGSGSGFPGVILAIVLNEKSPETKVILVESVVKKSLYLKEVCKELGLNAVEIINDRVENVVFKNVDVITARAVACLDTLLKYNFEMKNSKAVMLLLKGKSYQDEEKDAQKKWQYDCEIYKNNYSEDGVIMKIKNVRKKK